MSNKDQDAPTKSKKFDKWYEKNKKRITTDLAKSKRAPRAIRKMSNGKIPKKPVNWAKYEANRQKRIRAYSEAFDSTVTSEQQEFMCLERKYHKMLEEEMDVDMKKYLKMAYIFVTDRLQELAWPAIKKLRDEKYQRAGDSDVNAEEE